MTNYVQPVFLAGAAKKNPGLVPWMPNYQRKQPISHVHDIQYVSR